MGEIVEIRGEEFRRMQLLELDMIKELDRVCRKNHIRYSIICGTLLGAVRHKGYIPWDDDADIGMLRKEYEKFRKVANQLDSSICYFQDHTTDKEYRWGYGKLRRTGTSFIRAGQEHLKCKTGVFIDIFPLDDIPNSTIGQMINDFQCFIIRKIMYSEVGRLDKSNNVFQRIIYSALAKIPNSFTFKLLKPLTRSRGRSCKRVRLLTFKSFGKLYTENKVRDKYGMPKKWFKSLREYEFEGYKFMGPKDYDGFLRYMYDDYMTLPPVEKRDPHSPVSSYRF